MSSATVDPPQPFRTTVRTILRERLLDAAAATFADKGWRRLTMTVVADRSGVSRQTVYNEFGTKQQMAEQLVMRELDFFLGVVRTALVAQDDPILGVRAAVVASLEAAAESALLRAVIGGEHVGDEELLPFIIQSQVLIDVSVAFVVDLIAERYPGLHLDARQRTVAVDALVRMVLSHITRPSRPPAEVGDELGWIVGNVLAAAAP